MIMRVLLLILVLIIPASFHAKSREPWVNRLIILAENIGCTSVPFDGVPYPYRPFYLNMRSDAPVIVMVYNGSRFIRENLMARKSIVFRFVNKDGFYIEVCRSQFSQLKRKKEQDLQIKAGAKIPAEQIIPELGPELSKEIKLTISSN